MSQLSLHALSAAPDAISPDGGAEIRHILVSPGGDLTHAVCPVGSTSGVHHLPDLDEAYFVLSGAGEIWRETEERDAVTALCPGRWVAMPAGMRFQYRANLGSTIVFLVVVLPSWRPELFHITDGGRWLPGLTNGAPPTGQAERDDSWLATDLPNAPDYWAPDGSEIRLLGSFERGGLAHCTLPAGFASAPVRHQTVHESWFVLEGYGELWRATTDGEEAVVTLWPGVGVEIATGTAFQFRTTGANSLRIAILTMPQWPGPSEAVPVRSGAWAATRVSQPHGTATT
jgi:mannose-6-phosphate isomerase-like protein (cupin superfamily)